MESPPVQEADVILAKSKLKNTKSTGHDEINLQHIKESLMVTIPYITLIINTSVATKVYPKPWKHSVIIPIHKSDKILEKDISTQLTEYLQLLLAAVIACRNNSCTEQALVNVTEQIYKFCDKS